MYMASCIIVEDEPSGQKLLELLLKKNFPEIKLLAILDSKSAAIDYLCRQPVDIVFLDNQIKGGSGLEVVDSTSHLSVLFVYVSAYAQYAVEALNRGAVYYLLKPFQEEAFCDAVAKALQKLSERSQLLVLGTGRQDLVKIEDIVFIESSGPYSTFHLKNKNQITNSKNLGYYQTKLPADKFYRIHHSYIVNIQYVQTVKKGMKAEVVLSGNNVTLPVSQRKAKAFFAALHAL
jgi:two-component system LytT family response regulator